MENKVRKSGNYEMFLTTKKHLILNLDNKEWYVLIEGQKGTVIVGSDSDHQKSKEVGSGKYLLVEFNDDPDFNDVPHLFLEKSGKYEEWILPQLFPKEKGDKKKVIVTKEKVDGEDIDNHIDKRIAGNIGARKISGTKKDASTDLQSKNREELMKIARQKGLKNISKLKKEELVEELKGK